MNRRKSGIPLAMHVALTSLLGCLLGVAIVAALVWDWWAHPDLAGPPRSHADAATLGAVGADRSTRNRTVVPVSAPPVPTLASTAKRVEHPAPAAASDRRRLQPVNA